MYSELKVKHALRREGEAAGDGVDGVRTFRETGNY